MIGTRTFTVPGRKAALQGLPSQDDVDRGASVILAAAIQSGCSLFLKSNHPAAGQKVVKWCCVSLHFSRPPSVLHGGSVHGHPVWGKREAQDQGRAATWPVFILLLGLLAPGFEFLNLIDSYSQSICGWTVSWYYKDWIPKVSSGVR